MPNAFNLSTEQTAAVAAAIVGKDAGIASTIYNDIAADFDKGAGSKVSITVPGVLPIHTIAASNLSTSLTVDTITEGKIDITLGEVAYSNIALSAADFSLNLKDFSRQITAPQAQSMGRHVAAKVAAAMSATPEDLTIAFDAANPAKMFTAMRAKVRSNGVTSETPLYAAVGTDVYAALLDGPVGTWDVDGKVRGISVREENRLAADEAIVYVKDAFVLAVRAPEVPDAGVSGASVAVEDGDARFAVRHLVAWNADKAVTVSLLDAFFAVQSLPLAVCDEATSTVTLLPNGGACRVLTSTVPA